MNGTSTRRVPHSIAPRLFILLCFLAGWSPLFACSGGDNTNNTNGCKADTDCPVEQTCKESNCTAIVCSTNSDCRDGYICNDNTQRCDKPPDCPEQEQGGCCKNEHCPEGKICKDKKCEDKPPESCKEDTGCKDSSKPKCIDGGCYDVEYCKEDTHCKDFAKPKCVEDKCSPRPLAKLDEECDQVACEEGLECYADIGKPSCKNPCDPFNSVCQTGTVCAFIGNGKGVCRSRNNGKREGEVCATNPCERNLFCIDWPSGSSVCARPCRTDKQDCSSNELCYNFGNMHLCVPKPPVCGPGRPCSGTTWKCDEKEGYCLPEQCPSKACPDGKFCRLGNCENPNCCRGDVCPTGRVCNHSNGQCVSLELRVPFCTSCLGSGTCASPSQRCIQLTGPDDKFCAAECTATKTCADAANYECVEQSDKRWFCLPHAGTCNRQSCDGVTCKDGEVCLPSTKKCIAIGQDVCKPCTLDIQCGGPTDKCIIPDGETSGTCGKDCSGCSVCARGYACKTFSDSVKQCVPISGKCE